MKKKCIKLTLLFLTLLLTFSNVYATECTTDRKYVACGEGGDKVTGIPIRIPEITSFTITFLQIVIPVVLIIMGMIEMVKAIVAGNPDNVAKSRDKLIKKFVAAIIAFFVVTITTSAINLIAFDNEKITFVSCMNCFLNNNCSPDCTVTISSSGTAVQNKECGDYYTSACPKNDDYGNICKSNGEECAVIGHNSCSDYPADKCVGDLYSSSNFKCVLTAHGCVQSDIRRTCRSYSPQECTGKVDGSGRECCLSYAGAYCKEKECEDYKADDCPHVDASGVNICSVDNGKCVKNGYAKCSSYSASECGTNNMKDADGNICVYVYNHCQNAYASCTSYSPHYCDGRVDASGTPCKSTYMGASCDY